ncbi:MULTISPECIES: hypothetical protein [Cellulomonas]|uniref:Uncharacterized protein n=1 Tax=Cellulomonas oligotrophica TaxID=931536 RepID=A0A7Y9FGU4_9CELL|nr:MULTISPECIES: hypothetical protein [Cellulomonas]NYD87085.1 hypothetical protein [Cellulomonas oligotrophica]TQL01760.1 hypothetical protein FBY24_0818 [Cellulomonas sp. SLBN-39]GIG32129.1 hypothetical protein Col01nite_12880 [Cellulomonas oligotrophica]
MAEQIRPGGADDEWLVDVTDEDIRVARLAWMCARDRGATDLRITQLYESYRGLVMMQAQQIAEDFRYRHAS